MELLSRKKIKLAKIYMGQNCSTTGIPIREYIYHPEFVKKTMASLALIQMDLDHVRHELIPICKPPHIFANTIFYAVRMYTGSDCFKPIINVFKMDYVSTTDCHKYYRRSGLEMAALWPKHAACGRAFEGDECMWSAGTVLAAYQNNKWRLVGVGLFGPGCSAPSKYMDYIMYRPWVMHNVKVPGRTTLTRVAENHIILRRSLSHVRRFGTCDEEESKYEIFSDKTTVDEDVERIGKATYNLTLVDTVEYSCVTVRARSYYNKTTPRIRIRRWCGSTSQFCYDQQHVEIKFHVIITFNGQSLSLTPKVHVCDMSRADNLQEGNIGESDNFPWLGILRVNLHEFDQVKVAVTGLVLVKERYAIANAQDIAKIPKPVFIEDSNAMFIPKRGEPWVTKLKDYMIHHEFEFFTYNTIALVELELEERTIMPFKPVCWPGNYFNTTNLYALGYTDDNKRMEKTLYSLQYVKPSLCKDFYNRAGFSEPKSAPTYIQCGVATNNKKDCLWENGMAMVSNSSGKWTLIGFGVRGPGCSAPARFIDMFAFLPWVERATDLEQTNDLPDYQRKTAFNVGFRRKYTDSDKGLEVKRTKVEVETATRRFSMPYHNAGSGNYTIYRLEPGLTQWFEMPLHLEEAGFMSADRCWAHKILVYRDRMKLVETSINGGNLEYRVSLYDKNVHNYTCFTLKMRNVVSPQPVMIYFTYRIDRFEGTSFTGDTGETPSNLFKYFPMSSISEPEEKVKDKKGEEPFWKPGKHLEPKYLVDDANHSGRENINIIIAFTFKGTATVEIQIFGYPEPKSEDTTTEISTTTDHRRMEPPPKLVPKPVKSRGFSILRDQSKSRKPRTPTPLGSNAINSNSLFNIPKMFHQKKRRELPSTSKPKLKSSPKTSNIPNDVQKKLLLKTHRRKRKNRKARTPPPKLRSSSIEKVYFENMLKKRKSRLEKARERELQRRLLAFG